MLSDKRMKTVGNQTLRLIGALCIGAFIATPATTSSSATVSVSNKSSLKYELESKAYKLICVNKVPEACERILQLLNDYDAYEKQLEEEKEGAAEKREGGSSGALVFDKI